MSTEPLRVAVVGLGWMGRIRAQILSQRADTELVFCCDRDSDAASRIPEGSVFVSAFDEVLAGGVDAVVVSTPDPFHRDIVVGALDAGLDVFCEKPLATTLEDADLMIDAERRSRGRLIVGQTLRADPRYRSMRVKVAAGELGSVVHATSRRSWPAPEGARQVRQTTLAQYLSVHEFDALQWITGQPIVSVYGETSATRLEGFADHPASLAATVRFADGSVATHECTWGLPDFAGFALGDCAMSVVGTRGAAYLQDRDHGVVVYGGADVAQPDSTADELVRVRGAVEFPAGDDSLLGLLATPYGAEIAAFVGACRGGSILTTSAEARSALAAVLALEESLRTGVPCRVADIDPAGGA